MRIEDAITNAVKDVLVKFDDLIVDRVEIDFIGDATDITVMASEKQDTFEIANFLEMDDKQISHKSYVIALLMTPLGETIKSFLRGVDKLLNDNYEWFDILNEMFKDIQNKNGRDYCIQVVRS